MPILGCSGLMRRSNRLMMKWLLMVMRTPDYWAGSVTLGFLRNRNLFDGFVWHGGGSIGIQVPILGLMTVCT